MGEKQKLAMRVLFLIGEGEQESLELERSGAGVRLDACQTAGQELFVHRHLPLGKGNKKQPWKEAVGLYQRVGRTKAPPAPGGFGSGKCTCLHREGSGGLLGGAEDTRHLLGCCKVCAGAGLPTSTSPHPPAQPDPGTPPSPPNQN